MTASVWVWIWGISKSHSTDVQRGKCTLEEYFNAFYGSGSIIIIHKSTARSLILKRSTLPHFHTDLEKLSLNQTVAAFSCGYSSSFQGPLRSKQAMLPCWRRGKSLLELLLWATAAATHMWLLAWELRWLSRTAQLSHKSVPYHNHLLGAPSGKGSPGHF